MTVNAFGSLKLIVRAHDSVARSELLVLGAGDDLVLEVDAEADKVVAVAGDPHDEVAVLLGVSLRLAERLGGDDVELDVMPIHPEVGSDEVGEFVDTFVVGEKLG